LSAVFEVYETSANRISHSYHAGIPNFWVKKKSQLINRSKFVIWSDFSCSVFFSLYRYFIGITATGVDMLLQV